MFPWLKRPLLEGWVAVVPQGADAQAVHLVWPDGGRPALRWATRIDWQDPLRALRELRRRHEIHRHRTTLILQRHQYQLLPTEAPEVPREHWVDAVRWRMKDFVDFPVETARLDLLEIPAETSQRGRPSVLVAIAAREPLVPLADAAQRAGAPWSAMDLPETALRNLAALLEEPGRGLALLLVGVAHTTLVVTAGGELLLARAIDVTAAQLADPDETPRQQAFDRAGLELQRTLDSVERTFSRVTLSRLLIGGAPHDSFVDYMRDLLYVPVLALQPDQGLDLDQAVFDDTLTPETVCRIALGAALRGS